MFALEGTCPRAQNKCSFFFLSLSRLPRRSYIDKNSIIGTLCRARRKVRSFSLKNSSRSIIFVIYTRVGGGKGGGNTRILDGPIYRPVEFTRVAIYLRRLPEGEVLVRSCDTGGKFRRKQARRCLPDHKHPQTRARGNGTFSPAAQWVKV